MSTLSPTSTLGRISTTGTTNLLRIRSIMSPTGMNMGRGPGAWRAGDGCGTS